mmetsp:Transcript_37921/g.96297  ORF Transcript_37921/g.96297 Transcript_37921/m.96297 type:complete len:248 (-) Transcript_37921:1627-2370(-)
MPFHSARRGWQRGCGAFRQGGAFLRRDAAAAPRRQGEAGGRGQERRTLWQRVPPHGQHEHRAGEGGPRPCGRLECGLLRLRQGAAHRRARGQGEAAAHLAGLRAAEPRQRHDDLHGSGRGDRLRRHRGRCRARWHRATGVFVKCPLPSTAWQGRRQQRGPNAGPRGRSQRSVRCGGQGAAAQDAHRKEGEGDAGVQAQLRPRGGAADGAHVRHRLVWQRQERRRAAHLRRARDCGTDGPVGRAVSAL